MKSNFYTCELVHPIMDTFANCATHLNTSQFDSPMDNNTKRLQKG